MQAADRQVAAATAAGQATAAIAAIEPRRQGIAKGLTEIERMNAEITRDPLDRAALQQAAQLSARTATLEDSHLVARFELEDAEVLLANLLTGAMS